MRYLVLLAAVALASCALDDDKEWHYAKQVWTVTTNASSWALIRSAYNTSGTGEVSIHDYADHCATSGTYTASGTFDKTNGVSFHTRFHVDVALADCESQGEIVEGPLLLTSVPTPGGYVNRFDGRVAYRGYHDQHTCDVAVTRTLIGSAETYAGTVCGLDLQTELGITP